mmetsp:Transcript_22513/g.53138  ORF Transcript_22513/g.53138 Transcript_22513/m.53138 type:complete len:276 (+) Transcript_22513:446-1273(+)
MPLYYIILSTIASRRRCPKMLVHSQSECVRRIEVSRLPSTQYVVAFYVFLSCHNKYFCLVVICFVLSSNGQNHHDRVYVSSIVLAMERSHLKGLRFKSEFLDTFFEVPSLVGIPSARLQGIRFVTGIESAVVVIAILVEDFRRKGKDSIVRNHNLSNVVKDTPQILDVTKGVAGKDKVKGPRSKQAVVGIGAFFQVLGLPSEDALDVSDHKLVVAISLASLVDHFRREIDPDHVFDARAKGYPGTTRSAPQIRRGFGPGRWFLVLEHTIHQCSEF